MVGRKLYGGQSTHLPLKVNTSGVIPPIFASSLLLFPATLAGWFPFLDRVIRRHPAGRWIYNVLYVVLIVFFAYFYTAVTFNPVDVADNLKKYGGYIPGIRPGKKTAEYIDHVLSRITFGGAIYLAAICVLPTIITNEFNVPFYFGGTSLLIVVGVALDTVQQIEGHLITRHYEGFTGPRGPRIRGRRVATGRSRTPDARGSPRGGLGGRKMILILLGPPGAGKGTQAKLLAAEFRVPHISTGDMFRDHKARGTPLGKKVQAIMDSGGLVPDDVTNEMVKERLGRPDVANGFILDGYPRTSRRPSTSTRCCARWGVHHPVPVVRGPRGDARRADERPALVPEVRHRLPRVAEPAEAGRLLRPRPRRARPAGRRQAGHGEEASPGVRHEDRAAPPLLPRARLLTEIEGVGTPEGILAATKKVLGR